MDNATFHQIMKQQNIFIILKLHLAIFEWVKYPSVSFGINYKQTDLLSVQDFGIKANVLFYFNIIYEIKVWINFSWVLDAVLY